MIKNIIIGKNSSITLSICKYFNNCIVLSANELNEKNLKEKTRKFRKINLIFNNFYPSKNLNSLKISNFKKFCELSLEKLFFVLEKIPSSKIDKIIYTSSASIYRISENLDNKNKDKFNRELYSSFKLAAEKLVLNYAKSKKKRYYIMRLYNTYGNTNDQFSFIEKVIRSKKNNKKISLINNGNSIRDFIHVKDVAIIYKKLLKKNIKSGVYDLGTGFGHLIKDIVDFSNFPKSKIIKINNINELNNSIAENKNLLKALNFYKFENLGIYLKKRLKINKKPIKPLLNHLDDYRRNTINGIIIYGAGYAGKQIYQELRKNNDDILFFIDDDLNKQNTNYQGIPIISYRNLLSIRKNLKIKRVYLTIPSLDKKSLNKILKKIKTNFFDVRYLPEKKFLISDKIDIQDFNMNEINSILNRKQINFKKIKKLSNKTILVTGAAGTIGSEICRQLTQHNIKKIIAVDKSEIGIYNQQKKNFGKKISYNLIDICDYSFLEKIIKTNNVEIIFHAAAYKHVNILEENVHAAVTNNIIGTKNICEIANKNNIDLTLISTDKAAEPKTVLGYTKKICEQIIHYYNTRNEKNYFNIVRFGNVFGSSGSAVTRFIEQINNNVPITITDKLATRFFMTILEACYLVLETNSFRLKKKTFILNMGKPINIYRLAKKLAQYKKNLDPNYEIRFSKIGLKKNEKLHEKLFEKKEKLQKINQNVFYVYNNDFNHQNFYKLFLDLEKNYKFYSKEKLINCLNTICKN